MTVLDAPVLNQASRHRSRRIRQALAMAPWLLICLVLVLLASLLVRAVLRPGTTTKIVQPANGGSVMAKAQTVAANCVTIMLNYDASYNATTQDLRRASMTQSCQPGTDNPRFAWDNKGANTAINVTSGDPIGTKSGFVKIPVTALVNGFKLTCYMVNVVTHQGRIAIDELPRLSPMSVCGSVESIPRQLRFKVDETLTKELKPLMVDWFTAYAKSDFAALGRMRHNTKPVDGLDGIVALDSHTLDADFQVTPETTADQGIVALAVEAGKATGEVEDGDQRQVIVGVRWRDKDAAMARLTMPYHLVVVKSQGHWFVQSMQESPATLHVKE